MLKEKTALELAMLITKKLAPKSTNINKRTKKTKPIVKNKNRYNCNKYCLEEGIKNGNILFFINKKEATELSRSIGTYIQESFLIDNNNNLIRNGWVVFK